MRSANNFVVKFLKVVGWIVGSLILLLIAILLLIQLPSIQLKLTRKAVSFLEKKIGTPVALESIYISFPKNIVLKGIYMEDQHHDTLLYAGKLSINTDLWALTRNEIQLNEVALERSVAFVSRAENDSAFNFTYILKAFAGDSTAVPDTLEQKGWDFSLQKFRLEDLHLNFDDRLTGNYVDLSLGEFQLGMKEFDLKHNTLRAGEISLRNTRANVKQSRAPVVEQPVREEKADSTAALLLSLERLSLANVEVAYEQSALAQSGRLRLGDVEVNADHIDLVNQKIDLQSVSLKNTTLAYDRTSNDAKTTDTPPAPDAPDGEVKPWAISLGSLTLENDAISINDLAKLPKKGTVDFNHLNISDFNIKAADIMYEGSAMRADLRSLSFREESGFTIEGLKGKVRVDEKRATVTGLILRTPNSRLEMQATAAYPSLKNISNTYPVAAVTANINESHIGLEDVLYFLPTLADSLPITVSPDMALYIDAKVKGTVNNLTVNHILFKTLDSTSLQASGRIMGLPDARKLAMDLSVDKLYTTRADLKAILADSLLPDSIQLPAWTNLEGKYRGTMKRASFNTLLTSSAGAVGATGTMNIDSASALRGFNVSLTAKDVDLGGILKKPDSVMGRMSLHAELAATGLSLKEMTGHLSGVVDEFNFQRYRYADFRIDGTVRNEILTLAAAMNDRNLEFTLGADYNLSAEIPKYKLTVDLKNADFQALHLSESPIRGRGMLQVNLSTRDFRIMNGNVDIRKVAIFNGDKLYAVDSLLFASIDQEGRSEISINSDLLSAEFKGSINIFGLPGVVREYFNSYYHLNDSLDVRNSEPQHFKFNVRLKNTDLLTGLLIPKLTSFKPETISGEFDSRKQRLDLNMKIDELQYSNIGVRSFAFSTNSDSSSLNYNVTVDRIKVDSMNIDGLEFNGTVAHNSIRTDLIILDSADVDKYVLAGTLLRIDNGMELRLQPNGTLLNYQRWALPADNYMRFEGQTFIAHNVVFVNRREKLIIESEGRTGSPLHIGFRELNLEYLSSIIAEEKPLSGLLQGDINIYRDASGMEFTSNLTIDDLQVSQVKWGDLSLKVDQQVKNRFDLAFALLGNKNDVRVSGIYTSGQAPAFDLTAAINSFNLQSLQPIVVNQLKDLTGIVAGKIRMTGTPARPDIDGGVIFSDTHFLSTFLNNTFSIDQERISFVDEGISFDEFDVADKNNNKARLDGTILTRTYRDFKFNLNLTSKNFRLLNTTAKDNDLFYGTVGVNVNATIRGTTATPTITMEIGLTEGSDLTYVVPQSEASVLQAEGIVEFVDKTFEGDPFMKKINTEVSDTVKTGFTGIDLTARLALTDQETFTIVIDPLTGDQLRVKGNSTLTLQVDPTGDIHLTGRYEIAEGTYNLSFYKFVKREFSIDKGSTITWLGDPMNAQMDIRAIYKVETSPIELFSNQLNGAASNEVNLYKQRLPFFVYLDLTGQILQPEIKFELEMPMANRNAIGGSVYARLQDINTRESDLNKQVFALLILKRFIADDPFENQESGGFESTARRSVSKILSEQLNRLSQNIKGVELSFDIKSYEDYSSGQAHGQTELQLGVSKSLFNDRLEVKLSGNIDIEGENSKRQATDYIGDLALEYKITPDGRLRITGFRNSDYDMIDGELTETGAGLIYVKDYNTLSELFKPNAQLKN